MKSFVGITLRFSRVREAVKKHRDWKPKMHQTRDQLRRIETVDTRLTRQTQRIGIITTVILIPFAALGLLFATLVVGDVLDFWDILHLPLIEHD